MASTYLTRTPSSETNRKTFTISTWCKFSATESQIISVGTDSNNRSFFMLSNDEISIENRDGATRNCQIITNRKLRDYNGWFHLVLAVDTTQATSSNRLKLYVNGEQETSFSTETYPPQNQNFHYNRNSQHHIGKNAWTDGNFYNGSMAHFHFIDGTAYDASAFGSTDSTTGEWKINTSPSVTYGTNGFFILKDGNSVTDQSGNSNNFTVTGGTLTNTEDNPSNVFATWNPNLAMNSTMTLANGNLTGTTGSNYAAGASNSWFSTLGATQGKWYAEFKLSAATTDQAQIVGVGYDLSKHQQGSTSGVDNLYSISEGWGYIGTEGKVKNNSTDVLTGLTTWYTGDIVCVALDLDNYKLYYRINGGSWENSGDPTSGSTGTGAISLTANKTYFFAVSDASLANTYTFQANFGNGYFGTTAVSSAGTNASGNGIFEYDVPTGYTALSTKGLNL